MTGKRYDELFTKAFGGKLMPHPFQNRLAEEAWPDVFIAPTGLGKTAAVTLAWAYKRLTGAANTPRRLVWCLPMRTLVEQTADQASKWIDNLKGEWATIGREPPSIFTLLGGAVERDWVVDPAREAIIVGTQDMLISRALMRGYAMSRFRWPIDFALLHTDSLWVFDEVQLMGAGLTTSAQMEAFRRRDGRFLGAPSRSLWVSATLNPEWLATVDFRKQVPAPIIHQWNDDHAPEPEALARILDASKPLAKLEFPAPATGKGKAKSAPEWALAEKVLALHRAGRPTLVIVNRVARAQAVYAALKSAGRADGILLLHSRFRPAERRKIVERVRAMTMNDDLIVVSTQAVEAGVDISAAVLITDLAPWSSMVQRFGRCNRKGEYGTVSDNGEGGSVYWIDAAPDDEKAAKPYDLEELNDARERLKELKNAAPRTLLPAKRGPEARQVIRRKDFEELYDTDADLMGFDIDIAPYVRDSADTDVQLFWRALPLKREELNEALRTVIGPQREELCPAPIGSVLEWLKTKGVKDRIFRLDILGDKKKRAWSPLSANGDRRIKPGDMLMVACDLGGYDAGRGFDAATNEDVTPILAEPAASAGDDGDPFDSDSASLTAMAIGLEEHLVHVRDAAQRVCDDLGVAEPYRSAVIRAAAWHDVGKAHEQFQLRAVHDGAAPERPLAKATRWRRNWEQEDGPPPRPFFRHELASALAFFAQHDGEDGADLTAFLIAAHHGKVRMGLRSLPDERAPDDAGVLFARGVWHGDVVPQVRVGDEVSGESTLSLDLMRMGESGGGRPSWSARTLQLLNEHGPFKLALLEAIVRLADWKASNDEQKDGAS